MAGVTLRRLDSVVFSLSITRSTIDEDDPSASASASASKRSLVLKVRFNETRRMFSEAPDGSRILTRVVDQLPVESSKTISLADESLTPEGLCRDLDALSLLGDADVEDYFDFFISNAAFKEANTSHGSQADRSISMRADFDVVTELLALCKNSKVNDDDFKGERTRIEMAGDFFRSQETAVEVDESSTPMTDEKTQSSSDQQLEEEGAAITDEPADIEEPAGDEPAPEDCCSTLVSSDEEPNEEENPIKADALCEPQEKSLLQASFNSLRMGLLPSFFRSLGHRHGLVSCADQKPTVEITMPTSVVHEPSPDKPALEVCSGGSITSVKKRENAISINICERNFVPREKAQGGVCVGSLLANGDLRCENELDKIIAGGHDLGASNMKFVRDLRRLEELVLNRAGEGTSFSARKGKCSLKAVEEDECCSSKEYLSCADSVTDDEDDEKIPATDHQDYEISGERSDEKQKGLTLYMKYCDQNSTGEGEVGRGKKKKKKKKKKKNKSTALNRAFSALKKSVKKLVKSPSSSSSSSSSSSKAETNNNFEGEALALSLSKRSKSKMSITPRAKDYPRKTFPSCF